MNESERRKKWLVISLSVLCAPLVFSCHDLFNSDDYKIKKLEVSPTEALPLAYGDLSIQDILSSQDSQYVKVYPDGLVYLDYDQTLRSQSIRDLVTIKDKTNIAGVIPAPSGTLPAVINDTPSNQVTITDSFNLDPEKITEILLKGGQLLYSVALAPANPNFKFAVRITLPEFKDASGNLFSVETTGNSNTIQLDNCKYTSAVANKITVIYTLILKKNPNTVFVAPGTTITASVSFSGMDYKYVKGFFGNQTANLNSETINIKAFGNSLLDGADVSFAQPKVELQVINQVGVPTRVTFSTLEARKPGGSLAVNISPASPVSILFPTVMGDSALTAINVTNANALLKFAPTQFFYKASAEINKGLSSGNNFITDTSELKIRMHVEVPMYGHASHITLADTVEIDLSDADRSEITEASLRVKTSNQIPLSANLQLYLTDGAYKILDSLIVPAQSNIIKSSAVDAAGEFVSAGVVDESIPLSSDVLKKLFTAKNIIIKAHVNTTQNGNTYPDVKFKSSYKMDVKLGLNVKAKIKVDL